ncbi:MAG: Crotonyl-CoA carboxylase/reductase, ethylmalonyl-CoA producing, partial [uncultured Nocardioidaceae bacterium]
ARDPRRRPRRGRRRPGRHQGPRALPRGGRPQGRGRDVRGDGLPRQGPPPQPARRRGRHAGARPGRGDRRGDGLVGELQHRLDLDLRAGVDVRLPRAVRPAQRPDRAARPAVPRRGVGPVGRRAGRRPGREQVAPGRQGRRALPVGRAGGPAGPRRHDDGPAAAHLGLRDQLRRARRARAREDQPAHAQARPPDVGGGGGARPGELHRLPPAGQQERRGDEAGRHRPHLGRERRPRVVRHAVRPERRRRARLRREQPGESRDRAPDGRRAGHRPQRRGLPLLEGRARAGPEGVAALRQAHPRADRRRRHRHRVRAPRPRDVRRVGLRDEEGRRHHHLRLHERLHAHLRQPLPVDAAQADRRLALRELQGELGGQPAHQPRPGPPDAVADLPAGGDRAGDVRRPRQPAPGQGRGPVPRTVRGPGRRARGRGVPRPPPRGDQPL